MFGTATIHSGTAGARAAVIYVVDAPEHPFDASIFARQRAATVVRLPVRNWNRSLTPWAAPGLYRGEPDFGGEAAATLAQLVDDTIPHIESHANLRPRARAICGYSLGGLFALYALTHADAFAACACVSGSVWYEGWTDYLHGLDQDLSGRFAYLSLGTKERRAARPLLKTVQDRMEACANVLDAHGCEVEYRLVPGGHLQHVSPRLEMGLDALDAFLTNRP